MEKTHAIITYNNNSYLLTAKQELKLRDLLTTDQIIIDGNRIKVATISQVMTIEKFYEEYPKKRPPTKLKEVKNLGGTYGIIKNSRKTALTGIIRGLKKYINSLNYQGTNKPLKILAMAETRLSEEIK